MDLISKLWEIDQPEVAEDFLHTASTQPLHLANFINNEFSKPSDLNWLNSHNPRSGKVIFKIPRSSKLDIDRAVDAAATAFPSWSKTTRQYRSRLLQRVADILEEKRDTFALWESIDQGKTFERARIEVDRAIANFRYFATYILHQNDAVRFIDGEPSTLTYEHRSPAGVFALISPWNMPIYLLTWKIAPCLAFGCTAVAKPSEITSISAFLLAGVFGEAKVPPGVINIVFGDGVGAGAPLVQSPRIQGVSFTGGTVTGIRIRQDTAADIGKHLSLELGGKNPTLVFPDVDLEKAVPLAARAAFENTGQICLCGSRIYVHRDIYQDFLTQIVAYVTKHYVIGKTMGPVVSLIHYHKIRSYLIQAQEEGGTFQIGSVPPETPVDGYWIPPIVLTDLAADSKVVQEEIFGPVVTISTFDSEEQAILRANDNPNGLASIVLTDDVSRMRRVGEQLEAGLVWINCWLVRELGTPFGGMKSSGMGREGGDYSRDVFTHTRTLHIPSSW
ncbi:putative aldehyde dehydrogenase [Xylogone sp. PMI_703]|nr:putative aldehyde dehydrogenase [Xylogone sp. PMI_703]